jgi:hypothetical protein
MKISLTCLLFLMCSAFYGQSTTLDILNAIEQKKIEVKAKGSWNVNDASEYLDAIGMYNGKCMIIILRNLTNEALRVEIPEGLMLASEDTVVQDMLITKPMIARLPPKSKVQYPLYAMCSEIHDKVPNTRVNYTVKGMADTNLERIAQVINQTYAQNVIGQGAVWAYTDNATQSDLFRYGADSNTLPLTLHILEKAGVETELAKEMNYVPPVNIEKNKDSLIIALSEQLEFARNVNYYNSQNVILRPAIVYAGAGVIIVLLGASAGLAISRYRNRNKLS